MKRYKILVGSIVGSWIAACIWLILDDRYQGFLQPRFKWLVYLTLTLLILFLLNILFNIYHKIAVFN